MPKLKRERTKRRFDNIVAPRNASTAETTASGAQAAAEVGRAWATSQGSLDTVSLMPPLLTAFEPSNLSYAPSAPETVAPPNATVSTRRRIVPTNKHRRTRGRVDDNNDLQAKTAASVINTSSLVYALPMMTSSADNAVAVVLSAKQRRRVRESESAQLSLVMRHSAFTADPFNAIHKHLIATNDNISIERDRKRIDEQRREDERRAAVAAADKEKSLIDRLSSTQLTAAAKRRARAKLNKLNNR